MTQYADLLARLWAAVDATETEDGWWEGAVNTLPEATRAGLQEDADAVLVVAWSLPSDKDGHVALTLYLLVGQSVLTGPDIVRWFTTWVSRDCDADEADVVARMNIDSNLRRAVASRLEEGCHGHTIHTIVDDDDQRMRSFRDSPLACIEDLAQAWERT